MRKIKSLNDLLSNPLITTMIGVIFGGLIAFWTNIHILNRQQKANTAYERTKENKVKLSLLSALLYEIQHNLVLCKKAIRVIHEDGLDTGIALTTGYFSFQNSTWESTKSQIIILIDKEDILSSLFWFYYQTLVFNETKVALSEVLINYNDAGTNLSNYFLEKNLTVAKSDPFTKNKQTYSRPGESAIRERA